jgi:aconitase A
MFNKPSNSTPTEIKVTLLGRLELEISAGVLAISANYMLNDKGLVTAMVEFRCPT